MQEMTTIMDSHIKVGFIGFGEVATSISSGLREIGFSDLFAYHHQGLNVSDAISQKAKELGVQLMTSPERLAEQCDVILNVTRASAVKDTALTILPFLNNDHLYVDLNSCSPSLMKEIAYFYKNNEISFIDGVLMAPLPLTKHRVPIIVSGLGSHRLKEVLTPLEMNIEVMSDEPGDASSVKMVRSLFMKGLAALLIETFVAAKLSGEVYDKVVESMKKTMSTPFDTLLDRFLTGTIQHADRRVGEMDNAISFISENGMEPVMTKATRELIESISSKRKSSGFEIMSGEYDNILSFLKEVYRREA
jgi:3-hydroxyisobutyrate dehydrogenase-like beta-hydroxyacid dehydrogenase